jgi:glycosyltransferase involved in cell wall biosynthesis
LKAKLGDLADRLVIAGPELDASAETNETLATVSSDEGIQFIPMFPVDVGRLGYFARLPSIVVQLWRIVGQAQIVHAGPSHPTRPFEILAVLLAKLRGKRTIYVTDIDHRQSPAMLHRAGMLSKRQYLMTRWVWGPAMNLQHHFAARFCSLVLLKGAQMARDYGRGRPNVKNFIDAAFDNAHLVSPARLLEKASHTGDGPLRLVYFGRLVAYKGVDHMLRAVQHAANNGVDVRFEIIGDGPEQSRLAAMAADLKIQHCTDFLGAMPFNDAFFDRVRESHVLLAAPLSEDTPRSAFDALASGLTVLAYDTYYYRELREAGAPVTLVPWMDPQAMGEALIAIAADRVHLGDSMLAARAFAEPHTQEKWLDRRMDWTRQLAA